MSLDPKNGTYGSHPRFSVGDDVSIEGRKHKVEATWQNALHSPTGQRLTVTPATRHGRWVESLWCQPWDGLDWGDESVYREPSHLHVGDRVLVDWRNDGNVTRHRVLAINWHATGCESGVLVKLDPLVQKGSWWIDSHWCEPDDGLGEGLE